MTLVLIRNAVAFTFFSGPLESKLPVNVDEPEVEFLWNGTAPGIKDREDYKDGLYAELSDEQIMEKTAK